MAGDDGTLRIWNWAASGKRVRDLTASTDPLLAVTFSANGALVAASGLDGSARIWKLSSGRLLQTYPGDHGSVDGVAFSPDGQWLATAGADGTARRWRVTSNIAAVVAVINDPADDRDREFTTGALNPRGTLLVTASGEDLVEAWRLPGARQVWQRRLGPPSDEADTLSFDAGGTLIAVALSSGVKLLRASDGALVHWFVAPSSNCAELAPSGRFLAAGGTDRTLRVWNVATRKLSYALSLVRDGDIYSLAYSPDGRLLAVGLEDGDVQLVNAATGKKVGSLSGPAGPVLSLAFSPDGELLAGGSSDRRAWLWSLPTPSVARVFAGDTAPVDAVAISPNARYLATGSDDHSGRIWDLDSGNEVRLLSGDTDWVDWVGFSPDGRDVLSTSEDATIRIWDSCLWCESVSKLEAHAEPAIVRCLSADELDEYLHEVDAKNEPCAA
jgi:WD40 repeat protein